MTLLIAASLALSLSGTSLAAEPKGNADNRAQKTDNLPGKLAKKQEALRQIAREKVLNGEAKRSARTRSSSSPRASSSSLPSRARIRSSPSSASSAVGDLPTPDHARTTTADTAEVRCTTRSRSPIEPSTTRTIWTADFSQAHYDNLLYNKGANPSMANWYLEQSSGKYSVDGYVSDWVQVPEQRRVVRQQLLRQHRLHRDIMALRQRLRPTRGGRRSLPSRAGRGRTMRSWRTFDVWDRYDYDHDGDFDEPDGYIDHFQSVHAGEGEETGGGAQGNDAIWSHRWYAYAVPAIGADGDRSRQRNRSAACRIGSSNYWIGDYTIEPENGGVGVFAHEFAHDLGLPDLYDTSGNTGGAENSTAWWTIMSQGSYGISERRGHRLRADPLRCLGEVPARLPRTYAVAERGRHWHVPSRPGRVQHQEAAGDVHRPARQA